MDIHKYIHTYIYIQVDRYRHGVIDSHVTMSQIGDQARRDECQSASAGVVGGDEKLQPHRARRGGVARRVETQFSRIGAAERRSHHLWVNGVRG